MKKSWISIFMPNDEYKEQKMVYYLAESAVILAVLCLIYALIHSYLNLSSRDLALLLFMVPLVYSTIRYTFSGMEYTEVSTLKSYKKERRVIVYRSLTFLLFFIIIYFIFYGIPTDSYRIHDMLGIAVLSFIFMLTGSFISLKRSYTKNKDLLDD
ncbi:DUF3278 domain-containing protein [Radiobacillus kanasensis]|uniref:DUF3278 domain-containing protein n=1 Tax=Radiobacillus kanasensis TaxID=2844358 RepID=UPI001E5D33EE|nr:DUF3278 domain-containing protein [Radiobacillus kanasensis]UFT98349.1 DUF3278 domain-containing protein [Radiobacillus kanasensis]